MKYGEHWRRVLNSSKVLCGITGLRQLSCMEETFFCVTSELSWHWTDTGFSGVSLLEVTVQRLSFMIFLPYCCLSSKSQLLQHVPLLIPTLFLLSQTKSHRSGGICPGGTDTHSLSSMQFLPVSSVVRHGVLLDGWVLEDSKQTVDMSYVIWATLNCFRSFTCASTMTRDLKLKQDIQKWSWSENLKPVQWWSS